MAITRTYEYVDNPVNFLKLHEKIGSTKLAELFGFSPSHIQNLVSSHRKVRKYMEFACEQYLENKIKKANEEKIYIFLANQNSENLKTLTTVAKAMGIDIQSL